MRTLFVAIAVAAGALIFNSAAIACPCSPCRCSPCTCGGMNRGNTGSSRPQPARTAPNKTQSGKTERPTTQSKGHQAGKEHGGHGHGHSGGASVGVGVNIDLGGIGQRRPEPNPFAVSDPPPPPRTQEKPEKPKTKEKQHDLTKPADPFSNVALTGPPAKEESEPPGPIDVADNQTQTTESPPPTTEEKPKEKKKKPKPTWPKNIQDWIDLKAAWGVAEGKYSNVSEAYNQALYAFYNKSKHLKDLQGQANTACEKAKSPDATQADKDACEKALREVKKQKDTLHQDFDNTPEGKQLLSDKNAAHKALEQAKQAAENAAKDIDQATQDKVDKTMKKWASEQFNEKPTKAASNP
jgi:Arc/MetJ-type ribon-helix-helix transcriptional regulator